MKSMQQQLKRQSLIKQLISFGVREIDGEALDDVLYSTLLRTLAIKRAAQD